MASYSERKRSRLRVQRRERLPWSANPDDGNSCRCCHSPQVDVAFDDAVVVPAPEEVRYPTILDQPPPEILVYPRYTVVSEKFQAMLIWASPTAG